MGSLKELLELNRQNQKLDLEEFIIERKEKWNDVEYYFDEVECRKIFHFISLLKNDKGTARKFTVLKFQFEIICDILCVRDLETKFRRFKEAHINIARKNSKSFLIGIIMSYVFFCQPSIFGALFIITGNTTKQATELYLTFKNFTLSNKALSKRCKILDSTKTITRLDNNNKLIVLSNDGGGADSYSVYLSALDEIHEYSNDDIYGKLKTGTGQWDEPLTFTITTASSGDDETNLEMQLYNVSKAIDNGEGEDKTFYHRIFEAKEDCEIDDYEEWIKANPALGEFRKPDDIVNFANRCKLMPLQENMFRRMFLNQHVSTDNIKNAINMELWDKCTQDIKVSDLKGLKCYGALDLSSKNDVTGFVLVFYRENDCKYIAVPFLFTAKDTVVERENKDKNPYSQWIKDGELIATDGRYIKFNHVLDIISELDSEYSTEQIAYDRWGTPTIMNILEDNFTVVPFSQSSNSMSQAINQFENLLIDGDLIVARNSLFRFMAKNCIAQYNEQLEVRYSKKRSKFKIDGIIALVMALSIAVEENGMTHYDPIDSLMSMDWE